MKTQALMKFISFNNCFRIDLSETSFNLSDFLAAAFNGIGESIKTIQYNLLVAIFIMFRWRKPLKTDGSLKGY
jgi:hypothetical protein